MTVSSSTNKVSYSGNGTLTTFAYSFKIFDQDDLTVILRAADGTETTQTITTHYTVTGVGSASGGNVVFGSAPASGVTVVIIREQPLTQGLDLVPNDPFPAQSLEESLDKLTFMAQKHEEELSRAIKASRTNVITGSEFTISATDRANKVFAFDGSGDLSVTQELGTFKGNWSASTSYVPRDIVKDTSTNNIFIANTAHTSSGAQPLTTNTDSAKWDLIVDAASATTSATNAAASATTATTKASEAATSASNAATSETNAAASYDSFDDRYLGAKSSDPTVDNDGDALVTAALYFNTTSGMKVYDGSSWDDVKPTTAEQTNIDTVAGISSNVTTVAGVASNVTTVAGVSSDVTTVAGISSNVTTVANDGTDIGTVATNISNVNAVGGNISNVNSVASNATNINAVAADATDIGTVATDIANVNTVAGISSNVTTVSGISSNVTTVAGISANVTTVAGDTTNIGTIATNLNGTDTIGTVAGSITNVNNVGGSITNVNTVASNLSSVNSFAATYRIGSSDPTTSLDEGDLFYNTTSNVLKVYNGSAWEAGVTAGSGFLALTGGTMTGALDVQSTITSDGLTVDGDVSVTGDTFTITSSAQDDPVLLIQNTTNDSNSARLKFNKDRGAAALDGDDIADIIFAGENDAQQAVTYGAVRVEAVDVSDGTEDGKITFQSMTAGTLTDTLYIESGNVGIRTSGSPARGLHVNNNGESFIRITSSDTGNAGIEFGDQSDGVQGSIFQNSSDNSLRFNGYNNSEAMRIDSSGNLLHGKTVQSIGTVGVTLVNGQITATADGADGIRLNRKSSDGSIIDLRKDGTTVGKIGNVTATPYFSNATTGGIRLGTSSGSTIVNPCSDTGAVEDNLHDLGSASSAWRKLYLGGGVVDNTTTVSYASSIALTYNNGAIQTVTLTGNVTFTDSLADGEAIVLMLNAGASHTVTWTAVNYWVSSGGNAAPTLTANDTIVLWKIGSSVYAAYAGSFT
jgi:hypothetical protein